MTAGRPRSRADLSVAHPSACAKTSFILVPTTFWNRVRARQRDLGTWKKRSLREVIFAVELRRVQQRSHKLPPRPRAIGLQSRHSASQSGSQPSRCTKAYKTHPCLRSRYGTHSCVARPAEGMACPPLPICQRACTDTFVPWTDLCALTCNAHLLALGNGCMFAANDSQPVKSQHSCKERKREGEREGRRERERGRERETAE